jgi:hypothetical protein
MKIFSIVALFLLALNAMGKPSKAIFGADNRRELYQSPKAFQDLASGVGTWLAPLFATGETQSSPTEGEETLNLEFPTMSDHYALCGKEKFSEQPTTMISCTGFLIGEDLLVTAGHCMVNVGQANNQVTPMCSDFNWLFDYSYNKRDQEILRNIPLKKISQCEKVLFARHLGSGDQRMDFALIRLKKKYPERHHFKIYRGEILRGMAVHIMGHPSGLPLKYAGGAYILNARPGSQYFEANLDAVGGNSGSPVFNHKGEVLGILVRGNADFVQDKEQDCDRWNRCQMTGKNCRDGEQQVDYDNGMHVQKFSPEFLKLLSPYLDQ